VFLRSLTIRGFKSFADKTTLEFTPGISVIVGPNGSGKSNIADAIAWVLGEQGPRALRGAQMADVVFAGSPARPALGMAEVRLVIDNSAGLIPVPASEIEISRSIFRSGESEYRLGGRPCRLLDIQELLSDTGMGRALHTIIGQGSLDEVLASRPEERRQFIEEAAGIAKHRRRRERATRKLTGMEGDLLRLQDLVGELRRQLKPLKQQALLAGRYESLNQEAADLARRLAGARLRELLREGDRRRPSWQEADARQAGARARLGALDAQIAELEADRSAAEAGRQAGEAAHEAATEAKSTAEAELRAALGEESGARDRLATTTNRSGRLFALEEELARTEEALSEVLATLEIREQELEEAEGSFRTAELARRDAEEERRRMQEQTSARRAEAEALRLGLGTHGAERDRLAAAVRELTVRVLALRRYAREFGDDVERLDAREQPIAAELERLRAERSTLTHELAGLEAEERGLVARQESVEARRTDMAESPGAAFARRRGDRPLGVLRELIDAPPHLRAAVRATLGPFADSVVYASEDDAFRDAAAGEGAGVLLSIADEATPPDGIGGERPLVDALRPDPRVRGLASRLIGQAYLVNNLAEAAAKHRVHPHVRFVTPEGAVVGPSFIQTSAGVDPRLDGIRRESAALERELAGVRRGLREGRQRLEEVQRRVGSLERELEDVDGRISAAADAMATARAELAILEREHELVSERLATVGAAAEEASARLADLASGPQTNELAPLPGAPVPPVNLRVEVEALRRDRGRLQTGVARARKEISELAAEDPVELRRVLRDAEARRSQAEEALRSAEEALEPAAEEHRRTAEAARSSMDRHDRANREWRQAATTLETLRAEHEEEDRARQDLERRMSEAERVLREGHGTEPQAVLDTLGEADTVEELQRRSDLVGRRLGLLGKVNLLATDELDSLQERHDFLVRELDDVRAARRDLARLIADIDRQMAELFEAAFRDVAREFTDLFAQLFPGGEGRLTLTEPGDLLGSGIEVEARPGRKRVRRLSLLSGGERALAALAFLFAIFRARPSPFYLMDEVEAALDDVNLHRFLDIVREFARDSQILVVTHQKRTMEMADVLYGVSMGQGGASAVISQRLAEVHAG
jgi:chromosome segregation protein